MRVQKRMSYNPNEIIYNLNTQKKRREFDEFEIV